MRWRLYCDDSCWKTVTRNEKKIWKRVKPVLFLGFIPPLSQRSLPSDLPSKYVCKHHCGLNVLPSRQPRLSDNHSLFLPSSSPMTTRLLTWQRLLTYRPITLFTGAWMPKANRPQHCLEALSTAECHNIIIFNCTSTDNQQTNNPLNVVSCKYCLWGQWE